MQQVKKKGNIVTESSGKKNNGFIYERRRTFIVLVGGLLSVLSKPVWTQQRKSKIKPNIKKSIAKKYFKALWTGDFATVKNSISSDYIMSGGDGRPRARGFQETKHAAEEYAKSFSNIQIRINKITIEGDTISMSWVWKGTHVSTFRGIKPTHKRITAHGISTIEFRGRTIKRDRYVYDSLDFYEQLGSLPKR